MEATATLAATDIDTVEPSVCPPVVGMEVVEVMIVIAVVVIVAGTAEEGLEPVQSPTELAVTMEGAEGVESPIELAVDPMEVAVVRDTEGMTTLEVEGVTEMPYCPDPPDVANWEI